VMRLLAKRPEARFRDMRDVEAAIGAPDTSSLPLAGRQAQIDAVAAALERVAGGIGVQLLLQGVRGSGRHWLRGLVREAAARRGLVCVATDDPRVQADARHRVSAGEALVCVDLLEVGDPVPEGGTVVGVSPLGLADIRRSAYALAPATAELARVAERLQRESGGNAGLFLACAAAMREGEAFVTRPGPLDVDLHPWLGDLDVDERFVAEALAALPRPAPLEAIEDVAQVPAQDALGGLRRRGVADLLDDRWHLAAEVFRSRLLAEAADRDTLEARARAWLPVEDERPDPVLLEVARLRAQGRALEAMAPLEAAVEEPSDDSTRVARLLALAALCWSVGDPARARGACESALERVDAPTLRSRAHAGAGASSLQLGDVAGALDHLAAAQIEAQLDGDAGREVIALVNLAEARTLGGELAEGLRTARRALTMAEALRDRAVECMALRHLGQVLLEIGLHGEASQRLADAATLARAAELPEWRAAAWTLRAVCALDSHRGGARDDATRVAAASALDRLRPLLGERELLPVDPEGVLPRARGAWLRAAARLGDRGMIARAAQACRPGLEDARLPVRLEVRLAASEAAWILGEDDQATTLAHGAATEAGAAGFKLHAWRAACMLARLRGAQTPPPGELAFGLDAEAAAALARRA
jgi:tetratricopeptide (TPR) repeat protein